MILTRKTKMTVPKIANKMRTSIARAGGRNLAGIGRRIVEEWIAFMTVVVARQVLFIV
jgi:hypothetical protein